MRLGARSILTSLIVLAVATPGSALAADLRQCATADAAAPILERRQAFNTAIRDADVAAIEDVLTEDVVLVAGTRSDLFLDRAAQLEVWRSDFEGDGDRLIYVRTPECVERSELAPMALEHGHWRGEDPAGSFVAGRYVAKWRLVDGGWRIEAETFMTTRCGGEACPD